MVQGYSGQLETLRDAIHKQEEACMAVQSKDVKPVEPQKAATAAVKVMPLICTGKGLACSTNSARVMRLTP